MLWRYDQTHYKFVQYTWKLSCQVSTLRHNIEPCDPFPEIPFVMPGGVFLLHNHAQYILWEPMMIAGIDDSSRFDCNLMNVFRCCWCHVSCDCSNIPRLGRRYSMPWMYLCGSEPASNKLTQHIDCQMRFCILDQINPGGWWSNYKYWCQKHIWLF
jgi:hypothetical protein